MEHLSILITGASTGIGRDAALTLSRHGHQVFAGVRKEADGESLKKEVSTIIPVIIDVMKSEQINSAYGYISKARVPGQKFCLVNNAGAAIAAPIEAVSLEDLRFQLEVNVISVVAVTQKFLPWIRETQGRVVNMSSISGKITRPYLGPYSASKHAIEAISDALRGEVKKFGVQVCIIEPGPIKTPIWEKGIGKAVDFLDKASPELKKIYLEDATHMQKTIEKVVQSAAPVDLTTMAIVDALTSKKPKIRYPVGNQVASTLKIRKHLSDRAFDWLMDLRYGR
ncbi:MAG: SDR family NAD(P)-dependent oxidoreductase [Pseudobdellovibrionaceae bacterium]